MSLLLRPIPRRMLPRSPRGDEEFCRRRFIRKQGRRPGLRAPQRFTDRLYRLKVDGSLLDPLCQFVTDKEFAKLYVEQALGPGWTPETYAVLRNAEDIAAFVADRVPCVLKPTHPSGPVLFHTDPEEAIDRGLPEGWLDKERYSSTREANYRYLRPKVIVEEFLCEDGVSVPKDYKLFCFHGVPKMIQVDAGRFGHHTRNFCDVRWNRLPVTYLYPPGPEDDEPPRWPTCCASHRDWRRDFPSSMLTCMQAGSGLSWVS